MLVYVADSHQHLSIREVAFENGPGEVRGGGIDFHGVKVIESIEGEGAARFSPFKGDRAGFPYDMVAVHFCSRTETLKLTDVELSFLYEYDSSAAQKEPRFVLF